MIFTLIPMCLSSIINKFLFDIKRNEPNILEKLGDLFLILAIPISSWQSDGFYFIWQIIREINTKEFFATCLYEIYLFLSIENNPIHFIFQILIQNIDDQLFLVKWIVFNYFWHEMFTADIYIAFYYWSISSFFFVKSNHYLKCRYRYVL